MASQVVNGKAFEWAVGFAIQEKTGYKIQMDDTALNNKNCYESESISVRKREKFLKHAHLAIEHIFSKEQLCEQGNIIFLSDSAGQSGDVRDIKIKSSTKEFGISCKTNHEAYKHSRLSNTSDFVFKWGLSANGCTETYKKEIFPIFNELKNIKSDSDGRALWKDLDNVPYRFYWPILHAFESEIKRHESSTMCENFIKYLVGKEDFYKVVSKGDDVQVQGFNLNGTLAVKKVNLPTKIDLIKDKNSSQYSKTIIFNKGWTFNFRIHSASSRVEPSLKFDVQAISLSPEIYLHHINGS
jgi:hypothetical protein